jgi:hypothetical protein
MAGHTESTTTISDAWAAGAPGPTPFTTPPGVPFQSPTLRVHLTPLTMATGRENAPTVPRGKIPMVESLIKACPSSGITKSA